MAGLPSTGVLQQWDKVPEDIGEAELAEDDHLINRKEQDLNGLDDFPPLVTGQAQHGTWTGAYKHWHSYVKIVNQRSTSVFVRARGFEKKTLTEWDMALGVPTPVGAADLKAKGVYQVTPPQIQEFLIQKRGTVADGDRLDIALVSTMEFKYCLVQLKENDANGRLIGVISIPARTKLTTHDGDNV